MAASRQSWNLSALCRARGSDQVEIASFAHLQHRCVVRQYVRIKFAQAAVLRDRNKMTQQRLADPFALILIDDHKSQFRLARLPHDIASAADNFVSSVCLDDCD